MSKRSDREAAPAGYPVDKAGNRVNEPVSPVEPVHVSGTAYVAPVAPVSVEDGMLNALRYARDQRFSSSNVWITTVLAAIAAAEGNTVDSQGRNVDNQGRNVDGGRTAEVERNSRNVDSNGRPVEDGRTVESSNRIR